MTLAALQQLACEIGLHKYSDNTSQKMLIRAIQKHRGEEACFLTDKRYSCDADCEWKNDCQKLRAVWLR
jgi:hypothetical protein